MNGSWIVARAPGGIGTRRGPIDLGCLAAPLPRELGGKVSNFIRPGKALPIPPWWLNGAVADHPLRHLPLKNRKRSRPRLRNWFDLVSFAKVSYHSDSCGLARESRFAGRFSRWLCGALYPRIGGRFPSSGTTASRIAFESLGGAVLPGSSPGCSTDGSEAKTADGVLRTIPSVAVLLLARRVAGGGPRAEAFVLTGRGGAFVAGMCRKLMASIGN